MLTMDARIGRLISGRFYAFAHGWDQPETVGTLAQVELALGIRNDSDGCTLPLTSSGTALALQACSVREKSSSCLHEGMELVDAPADPIEARPGYFIWCVTMSFQYPAWDQKDGITYHDIVARSKSDANTQARMLARIDGHAIGGAGKYWFSAKRVT